MDLNKANAMAASRLAIGVNAPAPIHHVSENTLQSVADLLTELFPAYPNALSKGQAQGIAKQAVARNYILTKRLQLMEDVVKYFRTEIVKLEPGDPLYIAAMKMLDTFDEVLHGDYK